MTAYAPDEPLPSYDNLRAYMDRWQANEDDHLDPPIFTRFHYRELRASLVELSRLRAQLAESEKYVAASHDTLENVSEGFRALIRVHIGDNEKLAAEVERLRADAQRGQEDTALWDWLEQSERCLFCRVVGGAKLPDGWFLE